MRIITIVLLIMFPIYLFSQSQFMIERAIPFKAGNKWGWSDIKTNKLLIEPIYDSVNFDNEKDFIVYDNGKASILNCENFDKCFVIPQTANEFLNKTTIDLDIIGVKKIAREYEGIIKPDNNFNYGNKHRDEKIILEGTTVYNSNQYFNNYLIVQNKKGDRFGLINTSTDSIVLKPDYKEINIIKRTYDYFVLAKKKDKYILIFKNKKLSENEYDEVFYDENSEILILKKNNLIGFIFMSQTNAHDLKFTIFEPKYTSYKYSKIYTNVHNNRIVINVKDMKNKNYYISNYGFEYKSPPNN